MKQETPRATVRIPALSGPGGCQFDVVDRSRRMFDQVTVLVAVNDDKRPSQPTVARAREIRGLLPVGWENVAVAAWRGLTVDYCRRYGCGVIIRGVRNATDCWREYELAAMNEVLGVTTLFVPARPELVTMSSTAVRAQRARGAVIDGGLGWCVGCRRRGRVRHGRGRSW
ncbi:hypothetical protein AB0C02_13960 [Micromonospora sp. NPDC048999]|uniref:hypothetical protein n=1 Tax=Micromonospora sp. NPDC048999 TaxID=3155391 RepID=UPI0033C4CC8D